MLKDWSSSMSRCIKVWDYLHLIRHKENLIANKCCKNFGRAVYMEFLSFEEMPNWGLRLQERRRVTEKGGGFEAEGSWTSRFFDWLFQVFAGDPKCNIFKLLKPLSFFYMQVNCIICTSLSWFRRTMPKKFGLKRRHWMRHEYGRRRSVCTSKAWMIIEWLEFIININLVIMITGGWD